MFKEHGKLDDGRRVEAADEAGCTGEGGRAGDAGRDGVHELGLEAIREGGIEALREEHNDDEMREAVIAA